MEYLPNDPDILISSINMLLRDEEYDSLESLCYAFNRSPQEVKDKLLAHGYVYNVEQRQFRPKDLISKDSIETAYCFFHQKERIYAHSTLSWQKEDIEYAIASYVEDMSKMLYQTLSNGKKDFLLNHSSFHSDLVEATLVLEKMLSNC